MICLCTSILPGLCPLIPGDNDIDQLGKMIHLLGSIEDHWTGVEELPDYGKVTFPISKGTPLSELLPAASTQALQLLEHFLR